MSGQKGKIAELTESLQNFYLKMLGRVSYEPLEKRPWIRQYDIAWTWFIHFPIMFLYPLTQAIWTELSFEKSIAFYLLPDPFNQIAVSHLSNPKIFALNLVLGKLVFYMVLAWFIFDKRNLFAKDKFYPYIFTLSSLANPALLLILLPLVGIWLAWGLELFIVISFLDLICKIRKLNSILVLLFYHAGGATILAQVTSCQPIGSASFDAAFLILFPLYPAYLILTN